MARRVAQRTSGNNPDFENFPYAKGDAIKCSNDGTGEIVTGKYDRLTKDRSKILVIVEGKQRFRWLVLNDIVIERDN